MLLIFAGILYRNQLAFAFLPRIGVGMKIMQLNLSLLKCLDLCNAMLGGVNEHLTNYLKKKKKRNAF